MPFPARVFKYILKMSLHNNSTKVVHVEDQQATIFSCSNAEFNILCVHGAGFTGSCWKTFIDALQKLILVNVFVVELRGHNQSGGNCSQLSLDQILKDLGVFKRFLDPNIPSFLIGHSLGGSLIARLAHEWPSCVGICLLDITEESALFSVNNMREYLRNRPQLFKSAEEAARWFFKTTRPTVAQLECIKDQLQKDLYGNYEWSISLIDSKPFWHGWFKGMDEAFLSAPVDIRLLVLAGTNEQLDGPLMKGQMQGKFQLHILPGTSHAIMLDAPVTLAQLIASNLRRISILRNKAC